MRADYCSCHKNINELELQEIFYLTEILNDITLACTSTFQKEG